MVGGFVWVALVCNLLLLGKPYCCQPGFYLCRTCRGLIMHCAPLPNYSCSRLDEYVMWIMDAQEIFFLDLS